MWLATFAIVTLQQWSAAQSRTASATWSRRSRSTRSRASRRTRTCSTTAARPGCRTSRQMFVITFLQFVTAATGVAACIAVIRGLAGNRLKTLGQLLRRSHARHRARVPAAGRARCRVLLMWQGTPMTFEGAAKATTVEGAGADDRPRRRRAGSRAIKQLGTNGGGYFGPNSAHPTRTRRRSRTSSRPGRSRHPDGDGRGRSATWCGGASLAVVVFATMLAIYLPMVVFGVSDGRRRQPRDQRAWASISPPARWKARKSGSAPACRRSGRSRRR